MANTIITKNSITASAIPTSGQLVQGELAVNVTDKRLFTENNGGVVVEVGTNPSTIAVVGNATVGGTLGVTGLATLASSTLTANPTLSGGTANGVTYLNGSKVLTSGSALQFDGSHLGLGVTPSAWFTGKAFEVGSNGSAFWSVSQTNMHITNNARFGAGASWEYVSTAAASTYNQELGAHKWLNAPSGTAGSAISLTQAMTLDASGNLLVGTTSAFTGSGISPKVTISNSAGLGLINIGNTDSGLVTQPAGNTNYYSAFFLNSSSSGVGNIFCTGTTTAYNTSSDYRLKEDWQPMIGATERVKALKPVNFAWKVDGSRVDGFLAHEAQEVVPECVTGTKDAVDAEGKPNYQGIDQSKLVPLLTAALQEALTKIDSLTARIEALEGN